MNNIKYIMLHLLKVVVKILRRLLKMTLCELLWTILGILIVILLTNNSSKTNNDYLGNDSNNPVIFWWTEGFPDTMETKYCDNNIKCDIISRKHGVDWKNVSAFLFYGSNINFSNLPLPRKAQDIIWGLYHEESPRNKEELLNEKLLSLFNFSSTYSRYSDVPFPLQYLESVEDVVSLDYFVKTSEKNKLFGQISPVMYLQSDCETSTERDDYVKEVMKFVKIDSYGECINNKELPSKFKHDYLNNLNEDEFLKFIARYKFVVSIENAVCEDYITEKFWRAIKVGTVPIYFGSPTIKDWLPNNKSAVLLNDFTTPVVMGKHLKKLLENDNLYEEYLEHKTKQLITNKRLLEEFQLRSFQNNPLLTVSEFECLVCKKIHERSNGNIDIHVVNKEHYNCPIPVSALFLTVNPNNNWVYSWESAMRNAEQIYKNVLNEK